MKKLFFAFYFLVASQLLIAANIEGPFLILSTPYHADGTVDYPSLIKEARFAAQWDTAGVIWPQSNDSVDLLTKEERFAGMAALVGEWRKNPTKTVLALGVNGDDTEEMLVFAREAERLAAESGVNIVLAARPPYYGATEAEQQAYFDALAKVARRPVIIQTYVTDAECRLSCGTCPKVSRHLWLDQGGVRQIGGQRPAAERARSPRCD